MQHAGDERAAFRVSLVKSSGLAFLSLAFTAAGVFLAADPTGQFGVLGRIVGLAAIAFFGLGSFVLFREVTRRGDVVVVDSHGIRDVRVSEDTIPWGDIVSVSESTVSGERFVMLQVTEELEARLPTTTRARWNKTVNEGFAATLAPSQRGAFTGYAVSMRGLDGSHADLIAAVQRFAPGARTAPPIA